MTLHDAVTRITRRPTDLDLRRGLDRLRFIAPVVVDSRVRAAVTLSAIDDRGDGRHLVRTAVTVEIEGGDKPALLADSLTLYIE